MGETSLAGMVGEIVTRIRGPVSPGEVRVLFRGCYETLIAYGDQPIERGTAVLVTGPHGAGAVEVIPWFASGDPGRHALGMSGQDEE